MSDRYQVVKGSESAHCCFEATVIDTEKETVGHPDWVCECFDPPRAHDIAAALNAADEAPLEPTTGIPTTDIPPPQDRMHRVGVVPHKIEVFNDVGDSITYTVHATSALDARCMAFMLDGGCPLGLKNWDDGHIELAITYTKVVE